MKKKKICHGKSSAAALKHVILSGDVIFCGCPEKQRDLARKGSVKNGTVGSPVNQQPKKNARTR